MQDDKSNAETLPTTTEFSVWEDLEEMNTQLLRGIYAYNFEKPSHIQQKAIKPDIAR